jgi:hypothetical protein
VRIDHLAVSARSLDEGASHVAAVLGRMPVPGGRHGAMGTHNRLLGLGDIYLEVIAIDPEAPAPAHPRWFDLDRFAGPPRLTHWIAACDDLEAELARAPEGSGTPLPLDRGDLRWRMAVPASGRLPFDDAFPALIQWQGAAHPLQRLPDSGLRLVELVIRHPRADALRAALSGQLRDARVTILPAAAMSLTARIDTPAGVREL